MEFNHPHLKFKKGKVIYYWFDFTKGGLLFSGSLLLAAFSLPYGISPSTIKVDFMAWKIALFLLAVLGLLASLICLYISLQFLFNRTLLEKTATMLKIKHSPFPPMLSHENGVFRLEEIASIQVFTNEDTHIDSEGNTSLIVTNRLCMLYQNEEICLLEDIDSRLSRADLLEVKRRLL